MNKGMIIGMIILIVVILTVIIALHGFFGEYEEYEKTKASCPELINFDLFEANCEQLIKSYYCCKKINEKAIYRSDKVDCESKYNFLIFHRCEIGKCQKN